MENNQRLHAVLNGINAPLLELAFFETEQKQRIQNQFAERLPQKIITAIDDIEEKFSTQKNKTNIFGFNNPNGNNNGNNRPLKWENVSKNEKSYLLSYFATMSRNVGGYSNSERTKLKKMPIYPTVGGPCVALTNRSTTARNNNNNNNNNNNTYYTFTPGTNTNSFPLSQESKSKVLERPVSRESQDLYEDLAKIIVNKALANLPITMGTRDSSIGNPAVISTAIRNSLREFNPLLEQMAREVEAGEIGIDEAIKTLQEKNLYLGARGNVVGTRGRKPKSSALKGQADAMYMALPDFVNAVAGSWLNDNGANIEDIVRSGLDVEDLGVVQGEAADYEPMSLDEIRKQREETIEKMKQYKSSKYLEGKAKRQGASDDMIMEGKFLLEQEARQQAEQEVSGMGKGMSKDEVKKAYDEAYKKAKAQEEKSFATNPLGYIRMFGRAGEGVAPNKVFELQERHRVDEEAVQSAKAKTSEGKEE